MPTIESHSPVERRCEAGTTRPVEDAEFAVVGGWASRRPAQDEGRAWYVAWVIFIIMTTLEQHNSELREVYKWSNEPHPNGIECPTCGKELWDSSPSSMLLSYPPKMNVHCPDCGYSGHRLA